ncbi:hypothetical protein AXX17_AT5G41790 [Arabidopsis thaliana]|jgi:hypothetical protein|uniref:SAP domain-containing protein n=1 Tax=Arabidopsis thaliana TaxID=3702 RepID=A0A178URR5_ARATH|nr:hypothetical protein AXX17_AT5G41790 [Arabidopsis thaliana]
MLYLIMVLDLWFMWLLLVALVWEKLSYFRIKELKDVLTQLGLSKQGKKQVRFFLLIFHLS